VIVFVHSHLGRLVAQYKEYFNEASPHQEIGHQILGKPPAAIDITKPIVAQSVARRASPLLPESRVMPALGGGCAW
jgi:hypothetical protein